MISQRAGAPQTKMQPERLVCGATPESHTIEVTRTSGLMVAGGVTVDEVYEQATYLWAWLEERDAAYVLATKVNDMVTTTDGE